MKGKKATKRYIGTIPKRVPAGMALVHNPVVPTRSIGLRGFRAWVQSSLAGLEQCGCGWALELGKHYRTKAVAALGKKTWTPKERKENAERIE